MQVNLENVSTVKKVLHIEVSEEDVIKELDSAYKELKKTAKVKGFRPGKVPRPVLERMFKKEVHSDVTGRLIQNSFVDAIKEIDLNFIGEPAIDPTELETKGPYKYDATVEIKPELDEIDFKGLSLTKTLYKYSDAEIEGQLNMLQKNLTQLKNIEDDRPAQEGDSAMVDYEGFKDEKPLEDLGKTENHVMKIGAGTLTKEFDDNIIGMKAGEEKSFSVKFPEDYYKEKIANLEVDFKVTLKEIKEEILPEIDDEFAKDLGPFENLDAVKEEIAKNLTQGYDKRIEQEMNEQIFETLISRHDFELPEVMVKYELEGILEETERTYAQNNLTMEMLGQTRELLSEKYRETAEKQVQRHIILGKIVEQEELKISDEELGESYKEMSEAFSQPVEEIKKFYMQNPDRIQFLKHTLLEKNAIALIIKNSDITEKEPEEIEGSESEEKDKE
ncbi:MAG: trigger factor [Desulfobacterales bacterium]|jgi:trigger factor|nr:trigger factor [Desulfobacteraceae bacterium]MBT4364679.1 trigger factor [Desulfobacteraceae bacterium]MBT7084967.1 trigger factor [Desulfobacterales bacterium]MBT7697680.1 trigger factor [Desulfobacterales bacterium]